MMTSSVCGGDDSRFQWSVKSFQSDCFCQVLFSTAGCCQVVSMAQTEPGTKGKAPQEQPDIRIRSPPVEKDGNGQNVKLQ